MMKKCEWKDGEFVGCEDCCHVFDFDSPEQDYWKIANTSVVINLKYCPFCGADIRKPVTIKPGMFGKFWTPGSYYYQYGEIAEITYEGYRARGDKKVYPNFTPGLPKGFNQDGTRK